MFKKVIFSIIFLIFSISLCFAVEIHDSAGESGAKFLLIPVGAKPAAMGESYVAVANDVNALYWNPAGLTLNPNISITAMHYEWFQDIRYDFLGFSRPLGNRNAIGFYVGGLYTSDLEKRNDIWDEEPIDKFSTGDYFLGIAYSRDITSSISFGLAGKGIYQKIDDENATGMAFDIGLHFHPMTLHYLTFGANVQNIGPKLKFREESDDLPLNFRVGTALSFPERGFTFATELNLPNDNNPRLSAGLEYWIKELFAFRTGYRYKFEGNDATDDDLEGMSVGVGFYISGAEIDYAYAPFGNLGDTHRISLTYSFIDLMPVQETKQDIAEFEERVVYEEEPYEEEIVLEDVPAEEEIASPATPNKQTLEEARKKAVEDLYTSGNYKFQNEMFEAAQKDFEKILNDFPGSHRNDEAYYMIGQTYFERGEYQNAIRYFQMAIDDETEMDMDSDSQLMLGYSYYFMENYEQAKQEFEKVIQNYPESEAVKGGEAKHWVEKCERFIK